VLLTDPRDTVPSPLQPSIQSPAGVLVIEHGKGSSEGTAFYAAKWRASRDGRQVKRRLGPAWLDRDAQGMWVPRRGRVREGFLDERRAHVAMSQAIEQAEVQDDARDEIAAAAERATRSFRSLALAWLQHVERIKRVKPATLRDYQSVLAEPGTPYRRGRRGVLKGRVMAAIGDVPASTVTVQDIDQLLTDLAAEDVATRTVNKHRDVLRAIFNFGISRGSGFALTSNPAADSQRRREDAPRRLEVFSVEQVEALARAAASGAWRTENEWDRDEQTLACFADEDQQLGELLRVACYTGLRRGELVTLRWSDVRWGERVLVVERSLSHGVETSPKSGRSRYVPLADQPLAALERLSRRENFTGPDDYIFASVLGDRLDPSALRRRYVRTRDAAGLPPLRFHDLRHTAGSLLVRAIDPASVRDILGHADLKTTERYLHAQRASALSGAATRAFTPAVGVEPDDPRDAVTSLLERFDRDEVLALLAERAA